MAIDPGSKAWIQEFIAMDVERRECVSCEEIGEYYAKKGMDASTNVRRWQQKFDPNKTGKIILNQLCKILQVDIDSVRELYGPRPKQLEDVEIIESDMPEKIRITICELINEGIFRHKFKDPTLVEFIKRSLDATHGQSWHVITVCGRYYSFYTYEMGYTFAFKKNDRIFLVYKTPDVFAFEQQRS